MSSQTQTASRMMDDNDADVWQWRWHATVSVEEGAPHAQSHESADAAARVDEAGR